MKVFEVLQKDAVSLPEGELEERLSRFDWKYEFADSSYQRAKGQRELELLENQVYQLWKRQPERALELWQAHCPWSVVGATPSFIRRLEVQE